jgi:hypothetical protein
MSFTGSPALASPSSADHEEYASFGVDHANLEFLKQRLPDWYLNAGKAQRMALHQSQLNSQISRGVVEPIRARLIPVEAFATPLLTQALLDRFKLRLDVRSHQLVTMQHEDYLLLRVHTPVKQTLLHAALQNFEAGETRADSFEKGSVLMPADGLHTELIWGPEFRNWLPRFRYRYNGVIDIKPHAFAQLCRTLDLGGRYQAHLDSVFKPVTPAGQPQGSAAQAVATAFMNSERDAIEVLAHIARMKGHISVDIHDMLLEMVKPHGNPRWFSTAVRYRQLHMLDTYAFSGSSLSGMLLIEPDLPGDDLPCVVYMPGEPETPLKEYASFTAFTNALRRRLLDRQYQQYFQRFVSLEQSHLFFSKLNQRLTPLRPVQGDSSGAQQPVFDDKAELYLQKREIDKPVFEFLYDQLLTKTYNDSRIIAVPTSDEDRKSRLKRWQAFESAGMDVLMVAGFFIPVLGGVMAVVAAGQLLHEAFVAVEDWTHGETEEALNHLFNIGENIAAMAVLGTAVHLAPRVLPSSFIESLTPVKLRNGLTRLWKPDLKRFADELALPLWGPADARGLIHVDGKRWLPLGGKLYRVEWDAELNKWCVRHPTDSLLHSPVLEQNGAGGWRLAGENPMAWDEVTAFKRLNLAHEVFTDEAARRILRITGADEALLRQVQVENLATPALLGETAQRFALEQQVEEVIALMAGNTLDQVVIPRVEPYLNLLTQTPGWPESRGVRLLDAEDAVLGSWNISPRTTSVIQATYAPGGMAKLLESVLDGLDEVHVQAVLGEEVMGQAARIERLGKVLSQQAQLHKGRLRDELYELDNQSVEPLIQLIRRGFPSLPDGVARELLKGASQAQTERMTRAKRIPLSIAEQAREYQQQVRLNRANEGFYLKVTNNPDTFKAGFAVLADLPGWPADLAIEWRAGSVEGDLLQAVGQGNGSRARQVMFKTESGYQTFDHQGARLGQADQPFFGALLQALNETQRRAIGLPAQASEQDLRVVLGDCAVTQRENVAQLLGMQTIKPGFTWPQRLEDGRVGYPMSGRMRRLFSRLRTGAPDFAPEAAVQALYPGYIPAEVQAFLAQLRREHTGSADGFNAFAKRRLKALAKEYQALDQTLNGWAAAAEPFANPQAAEAAGYQGRLMAALRIRLCWKRMGMHRYGDSGEYLGYELDLTGLSLDGLPELKMSFDHVGVLRAERLELNTSGAERFLAEFKRLRRLDLDGNQLVSIPAVLGQNTQLQQLSLRNNPLVLDHNSMQHLSRLTGLDTLRLDGCPIGPLLDLGSFPTLKNLSLRGTGINAFPGGLWSRGYLRTADLRENQFSHLTDIELGALNQAYAQVQLHGNPLNESTRLRAGILFNDAARARMGIGDARIHAQPSPRSGDVWMEEVLAADHAGRRNLWDDLESEPNAADLFQILHDLTQSSDFAYYQKTLRLRVWAMLDTIADNRVLREEVYALAAHPQTCADGVALVFSDLELHVRIFKILASPVAAGHPLEMFKLARGMARLEALEKIALRNIATRELLGETVDHVEVRMAYRIGLAQRLKLPEQIQSMVFIAMAGVSKRMLAEAETSVLALEQTPEFIQSLVARQFWMEYLEKRYVADFETLNAPWHARLDALLENRANLSDGDYLERIAVIQRERETAARTYAVQLTEDIAKAVAIIETPPASTVD